MYLLYIAVLNALIIIVENTALRDIKRHECLTITSLRNFEFQCPPSEVGSKTITHVYPNYGIINIHCNNTNLLEAAVLPDANFSSIKQIQVVECPLPANGFREITNNFHINNLQILSILEHKFTRPVNDDDLKDLYTLKELKLRNNNISVMDGRIFQNTPNLTKLIIEENSLKLKDDIFQYVPNLSTLNINNNDITDITKDTFKNLQKIRTLQIFSNKLTDLPVGVFDELTELEILELSVNNIENVGDIFRNLKSLIKLSLRRNKLKEVSRKAFENCQNIESIRLDENVNVILKDAVFSNFSKLKNVNLAMNNLSDIPERIFWGSANLIEINLSGNRLEAIPTTSFEGLKKLTRLYLDHNSIQTLNPEVFSSLENLKQLYLHNNNLKFLHENLLAGLKNLKTINLSHNEISNLHSTLLEKNKILERFIMNHNLFDFENGKNFDNPFSTYHVPNLKEMDLSYNRISQYPYGHGLSTTLEKVELQHNFIGEIDLDLLRTINFRGTAINLDFNNISRIYLADLELVETNFRTTVHISRNPINCDCHALNLTRYIQQSHPVKESMILKYTLLDCATPDKLRDQSLTEVQLENLTCELGNECTKNGNCSCEFRSSDKTVIVNCADRNLIAAPGLTLSRVSDNYNFVEINKIEVHLENNTIELWPGREDGYENVTKLYLQGNNVKNVTWIPQTLETLDLRNNGLQAIDDASLRLMNKSNIGKLNLGNNPWNCDCTAQYFHDFLRNHLTQVDISNVRCNNNGKKIMDLNPTDICPTKSDYILLTAILVLMLFCIASLSVTFYYKYKKEILIYLYKHGWLLFLIKEEEIDKDKIYDAFVSYSHKDESVVEELVNRLENGNDPYKLCIHVRNFIPGELIYTQITNNVKDSRRTIVVVSKDFLESVWTKVEFRTAHTEAMKEGRSRVIVIIYGDVNMDDLDEDLKAYVRTNTYVKWDDPWFWDKLEFSLPKRISRKSKPSRKLANMMQYIDEKFDGKIESAVSKPSLILDPKNVEEKSLTRVV